ncbi:hypothetical protein BC829DRAFT_421443 [Chytridium lagenaria]|nr:hypothetical protein BC829DRAFT_421443 [Chytridium lagenaria]
MYHYTILGCTNGSIKVKNMTDALVHEFNSHTKPVTSIAFCHMDLLLFLVPWITRLIRYKSPNLLARVLVRSDDGVIRLMSPISGKVITTSLPLLETDRLEDLVYCPSIDRLFLLVDSGEVWIIATNLNPCVVVNVWRLPQSAKEDIGCISIYEGNIIVAHGRHHSDDFGFKTAAAYNGRRRISTVDPLAQDIITIKVTIGIHFIPRLISVLDNNICATSDDWTVNMYMFNLHRGAKATIILILLPLLLRTQTGIICQSSRDSTIRVWDTYNSLRNPVSRAFGEPLCCQFSRDLLLGIQNRIDIIRYSLYLPPGYIKTVELTSRKEKSPEPPISFNEGFNFKENYSVLENTFNMSHQPHIALSSEQKWIEYLSSMNFAIPFEDAWRVGRTPEIALAERKRLKEVENAELSQQFPYPVEEDKVDFSPQKEYRQSITIQEIINEARKEGKLKIAPDGEVPNSRNVKKLEKQNSLKEDERKKKSDLYKAKLKHMVEEIEKEKEKDAVVDVDEAIPKQHVEDVHEENLKYPKIVEQAIVYSWFPQDEIFYPTTQPNTAPTPNPTTSSRNASRREMRKLKVDANGDSIMPINQMKKKLREKAKEALTIFGGSKADTKIFLDAIEEHFQEAQKAVLVESLTKSTPDSKTVKQMVSPAIMDFRNNIVAWLRRNLKKYLLKTCKDPEALRKLKELSDNGRLERGKKNDADKDDDMDKDDDKEFKPRPSIHKIEASPQWEEEELLGVLLWRLFRVKLSSQLKVNRPAITEALQEGLSQAIQEDEGSYVKTSTDSKAAPQEYTADHDPLAGRKSVIVLQNPSAQDFAAAINFYVTCIEKKIAKEEQERLENWRGNQGQQRKLEWSRRGKWL